MSSNNYKALGRVFGMATKEELSDKINELLKTDVPLDFTKMGKEDLEALLGILNDPTKMIQIGVKNLRDKAKKELLNRTLGDLLDKSILEEVKAKRGWYPGKILKEVLASRE